MERKTTSFGMDRRTLVAGMAAVPALAFTQGAFAQQNPVTAIDIALEPDATMVQHAKDANARLLKSFPKGFALDETHHRHVSVLQQFARTDDLDKIFAAANAIVVKEKPTAWMLKAFKYYYIPDPPFGLAGIVVEPTDDLHRLQDDLITAVKPADPPHENRHCGAGAAAVPSIALGGGSRNA
jgi:hypothetical protein